MKKFTLLLFLTFLIISCTDYKAKVESNTTWSGSFGNRTVDGSGNQTVNLPDDDIVCCVVQKQTSQGFLHVKIVDEGSFLFNNETKWVKTTAEYGVVSLCSND